MQDKKEIKKRLSIELPEHKHKEIKLAATERGLTIKDFIEDVLYAYANQPRINP